ncbi:MAG: PorT family protein [Gemmatimonadota bacterium]|nr:MAG: PorT family protein [Gemmatimonadota bacterium]
MKRIVLLCLLPLLATAGPAYGQALAFGVRGGANFANANVEGSLFTEDPGNLTAYHFGLLGRVDISRYFALQTEVWYSRKGFAEGNGDVALELNYFEIPVLAVVKYPAKISPHLYFGPVLGLESGCRVSTADQEEVDCEEAREGAPRTKGADSGLIFGAGVTLAAGPGSLLLDVMYNLGITDLSELSEEVDSITTRTWYLSAGYALPIGATSR